ncbi:MAG: nitroreductase family deazaflavin-dependent oxidoreductase [Armatimonadota bacterium]|nr:nitroreductase family deazaflavin-dependent oxidoreductase [Armatimonadota bacterium]MDR7426120.1 nitroreductase family deazaflavin-dependent oxidoreductase [Armatimonadota bacterium]MDR7463524.1 nitroreductase family deazaflavin-dependent oxidoreductase [Armatimonadota bacterium]MDR7469119.1 nitroreductase family deazaflavin-dependent oxidoreductase [Armatimonadota bacterium]MDR7475353.1 nitroreductase family deazaflavin-dependent oxidoreductase [Armatimonadota bacterium]
MAKDPFTQALRRRDQITITTIGRRTGRAIALPVWFVLERGRVWLLPTRGRRNHWFRNLLANPTLTVRAGRYRRTFTVRPLENKTVARRVAARFRAKYGPEQVGEYYSGFDAAVEVRLL